MISAKNIIMSFGQKTVLSDVSINIPDGTTVGVFGESGIGKSTLAKILCGVLKPDKGELYMDEKLLFSANTRYDRKAGLKIQMVYQQPYASLDYSQKIIDGFYELIRYHRFAKSREEADVLVEALLSQVGLNMDILNHLPNQVSGGEAQRIAIARCLLFTPKLLILDEASSMLDVSTQANVISLVKSVMEKNNGSAMLISHDRELVKFLCDQIYLFDKNHLKENKDI